MSRYSLQVLAHARTPHERGQQRRRTESPSVRGLLPEQTSERIGVLLPVPEQTILFGFLLHPAATSVRGVRPPPPACHLAAAKKACSGTIGIGLQSASLSVESSIAICKGHVVAIEARLERSCALCAVVQRLECEVFERSTVPLYRRCAGVCSVLLLIRFVAPGPQFPWVQCSSPCSPEEWLGWICSAKRLDQR